jgi:hypothetical protein
MKTLPCTVCGAESYERKESNKSIFSCPYGHQKASSVEEWNGAHANKTITELMARIDTLESELDAALMALEIQKGHIKERDEARLLVRRLLDPDWRAAGIEKKAFQTVKEWGLGIII